MKNKDPISNTPWLAMIEQLPLSRTEHEVVKRFLQDPGGRGFLPVADVLRTHKLLDESLELLVQGVQNHPNFAVARVVLARELFHKGIFLEAWKLLSESPVNLHDNVLAQKLMFKIAITFGDEKSARESLSALQNMQGLDTETRRLAEVFEAGGIIPARDLWRNELASRGIKLESIPEPDLESRVPSGSGGQSQKKRGLRGAKFILEYELDEETRKEFLNYHVVPLNEVFAGESSPAQKSGRGDSSDQTSIELDSTTLAEIYTKQEHYSKALGIYRRLLRLAPHNDLLRLKVAELSRLENSQRREDLEADPVMYDRMEVVEIIDRQMRFFNSLISKMDSN